MCIHNIIGIIEGNRHGTSKQWKNHVLGIMYALDIFNLLSCCFALYFILYLFL